MKKIMIGFTIIVLAICFLSGGAFAQDDKVHGQPAKHGLSGYEFGQAVKALATSGPQAVANHVRNFHSGSG